MLKHVVRAPEQAICVVDMRMGFGGLRFGGAARDSEHDSNYRKNKHYGWQRFLHGVLSYFVWASLEAPYTMRKC